MATLHPQDSGASPSTTLALVNPVIRRLRAIVTELSGFVIQNGTDHQRRMQRILNIVIDESMDELAGMDEISLAAWMHNMACVIEWTATGDMSVLPPDLLPFACQVDGIDGAGYYAELRRRKEAAEAEPVEAELLSLESSHDG